MLLKLRQWLTGDKTPAADRGGAHFSMLMDNSEALIMRLSRDSRLSYVSPASRHIFGLEPEQMIGRSLRDYAHPEDRPALTAGSERMSRGETDSDSATFRIIREDGAPRWVEINTKAERDRRGRRTGDYVIVLRDVTEHRELEEKLAALTKVDGLTGLANRRLFDDTLERAWRGALRSQKHLSMLFLDLDHFKIFNDTYGHQAGDDCLRQTAKAVVGAVKRPDDLVARYGGDELAVILPDTDGTGAVDVAVRVLDAIRGLRIPHEQNAAGEGFVTASIGVATAVMHGAEPAGSPAALAEAADDALYAAKSKGRNNLSLAPPIMGAIIPDSVTPPAAWPRE